MTGRGPATGIPIFLPVTNDPDTGIGRDAGVVKGPPKRDFWDGVNWEKYTAYFPRKSITGKWIVGKIHKRWRTPPIEHRGVGLGNHKQYATNKELFEAKLKGTA